MSRRFGRNQKRRLRAELAAQAERVAGLESAHIMDRALLADQSDALQQAKEFAAEVAYAVGRNAILAGEPQKLLWEGDRRDADRLRIPVWQDDVPATDYGRLPVSAMPLVHNECLRLLEVVAVRDMLRREVHAKVDMAGQQVAYGIGERALAMMTQRELLGRLVPVIASQLGQALVQAIKGAR